MEDSEQGYPRPMTSVEIALIAVGTGLVVFLAGVCVIAAVGKQVPSELWSAGSALSGGLLGILAPSPSSPILGKGGTGAGSGGGSTSGKTTATEGTTTTTDAISTREPLTAADGSTPSIWELIGKLFKRFLADTGTNRTVVTLVIVFGLAILVPLVTSAAESTELHALAAGSGAALLGMLASSPSERQ
jgi:hypothetical protein